MDKGVVVVGGLSGAFIAILGFSVWVHAASDARTATDDGATTSAIDVDTDPSVQQPAVTQPTRWPEPNRAALPDPAFEMQTNSARMLEDARRTAAKMEAVWNADGDDAMAAAKSEQKLAAAADSRIAKEAQELPDQYQFACRSSMCRIEGDFKAGSSGGEWATRMLLQMGSEFGSSSIVTLPGKNGKDQVVIYAFRPGHVLPRTN